MYAGPSQNWLVNSLIYINQMNEGNLWNVEIKNFTDNIIEKERRNHERIWRIFFAWL